MNILQLTYRYAPAYGIGGPINVLRWWARGLIDLGHSVTVFTTDYCAPGKRVSSLRENMDGIDIHRFRNLGEHQGWAFGRLVTPGLVAALVQTAPRYDVVHLVETRELNHLFVIPLLRVRRVPYVISPFGMLAHCAEGRLTRWVRSGYDRACLTGMLAGARLVLAENSHEAEIMRSAGVEPDRIRIVPHGVPEEEFTRAGNAAGTFRQLLGIGNDPLLLGLGRLHPTKGFDATIRAVAWVRSRIPRIRFAIVGDDEGIRPLLVRLIHELSLEKHVFLPGGLWGDERFNAYRDADAFVLTPTTALETSLASVEALGCGVPVITNSNGVIENLETAGAGRIASDNSPEQIGAAILEVLSRQKCMAGNARKLFLAQFSLDTASKHLEAALVEAGSK